MDKQDAAQILIELAMHENDLELTDALILGAQALQEYEWVEGDLRDWLEYVPAWLKAC